MSSDDAERLISGIAEAATKLHRGWFGDRLRPEAGSKAVDITALANLEARVHLLNRLITQSALTRKE